MRNSPNATVTMMSGGVPIQPTIVQVPAGFGDNAISWRPPALGVGAGVADKTFTVTVGNVVVGGVPAPSPTTVTGRSIPAWRGRSFRPGCDSDGNGDCHSHGHGDCNCDSDRHCTSGIAGGADHLGRL